MDISIYFNPVKLHSTAHLTGERENLRMDYESLKNTTLGKSINTFFDNKDFPEYLDKDIALLGIEDENISFSNSVVSSDLIRYNLYKLYKSHYPVKIVDLGNILKCKDKNDTYFAIREVIKELINNHILPVIIGGGQELTYQTYLAFKEMDKAINLLVVDKSFDLDDYNSHSAELSSKNYLSKIISDEPNYLFNFTNIGYQTYYVSAEELEILKNNYFDVYRLGNIRKSPEDIEPIIRDADIISFDVSAIRQSDAPGTTNPSPNGLYGEEACQIAWYAGLTDKLVLASFYEYFPPNDINQQTSQLIAQMLWYLIDGFYNRKHDFPDLYSSEYLKFHVPIADTGLRDEIIFYKSIKSDRWWMKVPDSDSKKNKFHRHHLVPCSYKDYQKACKNEIPEKWWKTLKKLV